MKQIVQVERQEISTSEKEIKAILEELVPSERELFELTNKRYRFNTPLIKIEDGSCSKCGSAIDSVTASQVEKGVSLEMCPGCNRILIPHI